MVAVVDLDGEKTILSKQHDADVGQLMLYMAHMSHANLL